MATILKPLGLAALIALGGAAYAQDTTEGDAAATETPATDEAPAATEAPATDEAPTSPDLDMGETTEQPQVETYVDEVFNDWQRECLRIPGNEGPAPCQITQFLREEPDGAPVGKVSIGKLPDGNEATAGSMIIVPLGVLLTQQMTIGVDSAAPKRYPFRFCDPNGCVAQIGYTAEEIAAFKAGSEATLTVVPVAAPDQQVALPLSLSGFTAAYDSLEQPEVPQQAAPAAQ
ncbi:MAG: invasion associated locus B family protein [Pseudomonadota bacterium]|nr:invasion associated locus B family protein [Pseudomonadota bacterium]